MSQGMWTFPNLKLGVFKKKQWRGNLCIQQIRLPARSKSWKERMATPSTNRSRHSLPYGSSFLDRQGNLRTRTWRPCGWSGCEYGYLVHISELSLFEQQFILDRTMRRSHDTWRIIFGAVWNSHPMNWKTDQWTNRDHWCTHDRFQRTYVDVDTLLVRSSLSVHQRQSLPLLRLCTLCRENGRWSCCDLEE